MAALPPYVSKSQVKQYLKCGKQYYLERIARYPAPPSWPLIAGTAVHKATERLDQEDMKTWSVDRMEHLWSEAFGEEIDAAYRSWPDDTQWLKLPPSRRNGDGYGYKYWSGRGAVALVGYARWRVANQEKFHLISIEEDFYVVLHGIPVHGFLDRVFQTDKGYAVVDIKNSTKRPASPLELAIYKHGWELKHEAPGAVEKAYWYMAKDEAVFEEDLGAFTDLVVARILVDYLAGVSGDIFLPNIGPECFGCSVKQACAAKSGRTKQALEYDPLLKELESA